MTWAADAPGRARGEKDEAMTIPWSPRPGEAYGREGRPGEEQDPGRQAPPQIVIVPAHPAAGGERTADGEAADVVFEMRRDDVGRAVLPAFSSVPRLVAALGSAQPWLALPLPRVRQLAAAAGADAVHLDPVIRPDAPRWRQEDLQAWERNRE
jgi:hypothetical protein